MKNKAYQIIYLNGPSSSGKTSLVKVLQDILEIPYLHVGIDKIIGMMPSKINNWEEEFSSLGFSWKTSKDKDSNPIAELLIGPFAKKIIKAYKEVVLTFARLGFHIIIDDVAISGKKDIDEWKEILNDFNVLFVGIKTPLEVLEIRESEREDRMTGSARHQYYTTHKDVLYDLEIDTSKHSAYETAEIIKNYSNNK